MANENCKEIVNKINDSFNIYDAFKRACDAHDDCKECPFDLMVGMSQCFSAFLCALKLEINHMDCNDKLAPDKVDAFNRELGQLYFDLSRNYEGD